MDKILILKNDRVGDLFHSLDGINAIIQQNKDSHIEIVLSNITNNFNFLFNKVNEFGLNNQITFFEYLMETIKIRIDNGQNKLIVFIIFLAKVVKKIISR